MVERFQSGPHGPTAFVSFVLSIKAAAGQGIHLEVVRLPEARKGFVLLPRCWARVRSRLITPTTRSTG
jgi:hypothetical protein